MRLIYKFVCSVVVVSLTSCGGTRYIQQSDVAVTTEDLKVIYFKADPTGIMIYNTWAEGMYGDTTEIHLVVAHDFERYVRKSKRK